METNSRLPLAHVLDLLLDAIVVVDAEGRIVLASAACKRIFGYTPEEMTGR
ncbi:MAG TPA: PAS domain-containing protein, partial [Xanthomonadaceae bacterium]|nr:PAS domain-containing protein [Xanthomonadaceae bacterium]